MDNTPLSISIIVPVYNGGAAFGRCLDALLMLRPAPHEIIVVADGDSDGSRQLALGRGVRVIELDTPRGPDVARNLGAQAASGDVLYFVDADVAVHPDVLHKIRETFAANPDISAIIGSYDDSPTETNFASQYKNLTHHYVHQTGREEASTFWGACGAVRREAFEAVGGFHMGYRAIEDIELGYRLKAAGYRIRLRKDLQVTHLKHWTLASQVRTDFFGRALPWTRLIHRDKQLINDLNLDVSSRLSTLLVGLLLLTLPLLWLPIMWIVAGFCMVGLLVLNRDLYHFLLRKRGIWFALRAIPWHWFYYFYSGAAFAVGTLMDKLKRDNRKIRQAA